MGILAQNESSTSRTSTSIGESSRRDLAPRNQIMYDQAREFALYREQQERCRRSDELLREHQECCQRTDELTRSIDEHLQRSNDLIRNMVETRQRVRMENQSRSESIKLNNWTTHGGYL